MASKKHACCRRRRRCGFVAHLLLSLPPASLPRLVENLIRFFTLRLSCFTYIAWRRARGRADCGVAVAAVAVADSAVL